YATIGSIEAAKIFPVDAAIQEIDHALRALGHDVHGNGIVAIGFVVCGHGVLLHRPKGRPLHRQEHGNADPTLQSGGLDRLRKKEKIISSEAKAHWLDELYVGAEAPTP